MIAKAKELWQHKFVQGGVLLTLTSFIVNILNYFFNFFVARGLGPAGYGELSAVFSYTMILSALTTVVSTVIIRKLGQAGNQRLILAKSLLGWFWARVAKWLLPLLLFCFFLSPLAKLLNLKPLSIAFLIVISVIGFISNFYTSVFRGLKFFWTITVLAVITTGIKFLGGLSAISRFGSFNLVLAFLTIGGIIGLFLNYFIFKMKSQKVKIRAKNDFQLFSLLKSSAFLITAATVLGLTLLSNLDIIFVKKFTDSATTGLYGVWSLWAKVILYFLSPLSGLTLIFVSSKEHQSQKDKLLLVSLALIFLMGLAAFGVYKFFGYLLISLIYGRRFIQIADRLWLAAFFGLFYAGVNVLTNFYLAQKDKISLVIPLTIPAQITVLYVFRTNLLAIMWTETIYSAGLFTVYLIYWLFKYNGWKRRSTGKLTA